MWGIVPAAGLGTRIQPLAFSKELLPVGRRIADGDVERPRAVSEYVVERMLRAGVEEICFVISPGKADIVKYYGSDIDGVPVCYVVQPEARGLCDAIFRAAPLIRGTDVVLVGLPDTVWFPEDGYLRLERDKLSFLLFPSDHPERFDAVLDAPDGSVQEIHVKRADTSASWIWGAFSLPGALLSELHALWLEPERRDEYWGTLVNAYLQRGGEASAVRAGTEYCDVGTLEGFREAVRVLDQPGRNGAPAARADDEVRAHGVRAPH